MFTLSDIANAHARVQSGADFPYYIQEIKRMGVLSFTTWVHDSHTRYSGAASFHIESPALYSPLDIATDCQPEAFRQYLQLHQQGGSDYMLFCRHCAESGVAYWHVDLNKMTCVYYDTQDQAVLEESIPDVAA